MAAPGAEAARQAEAAARRSYGRLLAWLAWQWRDIAAAEDALGEAFAVALERWPVDGVPSAPEAWLLTTAKRQLLMAARRRRLEDDPALAVLRPGEDEPVPDAATLPDSRLRLMFVCAHPAIDPAVRSALMLQTVLGLDAGRIASAFLVQPEAMTKRLVRAKAKIKATGIRFEDPDPADWPERIDAVLEAIYGAYTLHWGQADDDGAHQLAAEACYLAELVDALVPREPEAAGLAALLWFCEARRPARLDERGAFMPLDEQDTGRWNHALIARAHEALARAAALGRPGPFQLEAAIQAAHVQGVLDGRVPWDAIEVLHERLLALAPTLGARIGHAVAVAHARDDAPAGLALLDEIEPARVAAHQPFWAARARLLARAHAHEAAADAYGRALALTAEPALRDWLAQRLEAQREVPAPSCASEFVPASAERVWQAFMDPALLLAWLPPAPMTGAIHAFDGRAGGGYRISLFYPPGERRYRGKSAEREDRVAVRFLALSPPRQLVEAIRFDTTDPALQGEMTMTATLADATGGTHVTLRFHNLPPGLRAEDNDAGARISLAQLARHFA